MPNCRRRFATENEVTKHIDNHMNPNTVKARRQTNVNNAHVTNAAAAAAAAAAANHLMNETKNAAAQPFLNNSNPAANADNKSNILPRVISGVGAGGAGGGVAGGGASAAAAAAVAAQQSVVKNELYFPQCYGPPFQQAFQPQQAQPSTAHANGGNATQPPASVTVANSVVPGVVVQQNNSASVVAQ